MNIKTIKKNKSVILIILDGWGIAPPSQGNAIFLAKKPVFDKTLISYPVKVLQAAGEAVGLSWGEMGNSEVGHLNLGAGKIVYQDLPRINRTIVNGEFFKNSALLSALKHTRRYNSKLHLIALISNGNIHGSIEHLYATLELAKQNALSQVYIHAILDGRDTPFNSGLDFLSELEKRIKIVGLGKIASISGRYYAMDRDGHWERTEKVYLAMTEGLSPNYTSDSISALKESYQKNIFDEEFIPTVVVQSDNLSKPMPVAKVSDNDAIIFLNFRADRARQLTKAFVLPGFENFKRPRLLQNLLFVTMVEYEVGLPVQVAFPPETVEYPLARVISEAGFTQLHIAETEKYAHVTFFFNGGKELPFLGEERILIPSPRISSYDQMPEMSAKDISEKVIEAIRADKYNFIVVNFANPDMVGHTGNLEATIKAIEFLDHLLGEILVAVLEADGTAIITADHGNAEELINLRNGEIDKEHSLNPVPFILVGKNYELTELLKNVPDLSTFTASGVLADVAPTILKIMGLSIPKEMTGIPLV